MDRAGYRTAEERYGEEAFELSELARFRQAAYRLFSTMLLYPDAERLKTVAAVAGELEDARDVLATFSFFLQWRDLLDVLKGLADVTPATVEEQYVHLFVASPDYDPCLPYESAYLGNPPGMAAVELDRKYGAEGLSVATSSGEVPDHVAVELEFMACLCNQEAAAWEARRLTDGVRALTRQGIFLQEHLNRWFPAFAQRVAEKDQGRIYTAVTRAAEAFLSHDCGLVEALVRGFESQAVARRAGAS